MTSQDLELEGLLAYTVISTSETRLVLAKILDSPVLCWSAACALLWIMVLALVETVRARQMQQGGRRAVCRYPHREPLLGLDILWTFARAIKHHRFLQLVETMLATTGTTVEYLILGRSAIITIEPKNVQNILSTRFKDFGLGDARTSSFRPLLGNGIFNVDGERWQHSRAFLKTNLVRNPDENLRAIEKHVHILTTRIGAAAGPVDVQELFGCLALDVASDLFLGQSLQTLKPERQGSTASNFAKSFAYAQRAVSGVNDPDLWLTLKHAVLGNDELTKAVQTVNDFLDRLISEQEDLDPAGTIGGERGEQRDDLLRRLMQQYSSRQQVKENLLSILLAGKDATTSLLGSLWLVLSKRSDVRTTLQAEVEMLQGRCPTAAELLQMKCLQRVIKEVLRLFPPVPLNQRTAVVDTWLPLGGGVSGNEPVFVPKGTSIGYSIHAMHRRKDLWGADADVFDPERWHVARPGWAYLPFHGGPRSCIGQQFTMQLVMYVTVRLMQTFDTVRNCDREPWQERLGLNCLSRHGVHVAFSSTLG